MGPLHVGGIEGELAVATTPDFVGAGELVISAWGNDVVTAITELQADVPEASSTFSPNFVNVNGGTGPTLVGRYGRVGPLGFVHIELTLGTGGNFTSTVSVSGLPLTFLNSAIGAAWLFDSSAGTQISGIAIASGSSISQFNSPTGLVAAATPWSWASADQLRCTVVGFVA